MPADVRSLKAAGRARWGQLHASAVRGVLNELDRKVPDSGEAHAGKLRDERRTKDIAGPNRFATTIEYPSNIARYNDRGTPPHDIEPIGTGYPLRFYWTKAGAVVRFMKVHHPGSTKHVGWFTKTIPRYAVHLRAAARALR